MFVKNPLAWKIQIFEFQKNFFFILRKFLSRYDSDPHLDPESKFIGWSVSEKVKT